MKIAIIGTGNVGGAIAHGLKGKGHSVILGARDPGDDSTRALAAETDATAATPANAVIGADIVILALPWSAAEAAVRALGTMDGRIVVDCMNPLGMVDGQLGLVLGHTTSGGEIVQDWLPEARVVKTLNQVGAEMMADSSRLPHRPVMFMAGNDAAAKTSVAAMLSDLGFEALDAGDITKSRILEPFGMVWINQALIQGKGRAWAFAAVSSIGMPNS
jgi:hypothetical protein